MRLSAKAISDSLTSKGLLWYELRRETPSPEAIEDAVGYTMLFIHNFAERVFRDEVEISEQELRSLEEYFLNTLSRMAGQGHCSTPHKA